MPVKGDITSKKNMKRPAKKLTEGKLPPNVGFRLKPELIRALADKAALLKKIGRAHV